mmetsp:Transcript_36240/g.56778  ORF Transcript_36240/g.56778 Transcript_36240/m.56778 type:complete len:110 (-) Transcript_36240:1260-1589(-)
MPSLLPFVLFLLPVAILSQSPITCQDPDHKCTSWSTSSCGERSCFDDLTALNCPFAADSNVVCVRDGGMSRCTLRCTTKTVFSNTRVDVCNFVSDSLCQITDGLSHCIC